MTKKSTDLITPELSPNDDNSMRIGEQYHVAGGMKAVYKAAIPTINEPGLFRGVMLWLQINQNSGFDCPSCAWPDSRDGRNRFEFCENGAKAIADESTRKRADPAFFDTHSVSDLSTQTDHWLNQQGRLTHPMILREGETHYKPITWDDAIAVIANHLIKLSSPDQALFYTSGRTSNEAAFLYQLFVRQFGTNNLPDCSNMCHESSGFGLSTTLGTGKSTVSLAELENAELIVIIGQNPGTNHPRMLTSLEIAAKRGAKIVNINPLHEAGTTRFKHPQHPDGIFGPGTQLESLFLQVRINGDAALLKGVMKALLELDTETPGTVLDHSFINEYTIGYGDFAADIRRTHWKEIEDASGILEAQVREFAALFAASKRTVCCWAMGLTQHKNGVNNIQALANLMMLRGQIGDGGSGLFCVRGHSNVQGDRTMGVWERALPAFLDALAQEFDFSPPRKHGLDTVRSIQAMVSGDAKIFLAMGGNFLSATPDTHVTALGLRNCDLTAHVSTKLNRSHLVTGKTAIILPCLGRTERDTQETGDQFVTVEDSACIVHASRGRLTPASTQLRSEPWIVANLANKVLAGRTKVNWLALTGDYNKIREHISHVIPGFENFNTLVTDTNGFELPRPVRDRQFRTNTQKANFFPVQIPIHTLDEGQLILMSIRSHDQFNTTIYGLDDRYRGIRNGRRVVFMNIRDIRSRGLRAGQSVDITSHFQGQLRTVDNFTTVPYSIPIGCAAAYFPEINPLVALNNCADISGTPVSKSIVITIDGSKTL